MTDRDAPSATSVEGVALDHPALPGIPDPSVGDAFATHLGLRWRTTGKVALDVRPDLLNANGVLLGPVGFALVDYAMGSAMYPTLGAGQTMATMWIGITYIHGARLGEVTCSASLRERTRRTGVLAADLHDRDGRLLATAQGTFAVLEASAATRR